MDGRLAGLGILLFIVFWGFQWAASSGAFTGMLGMMGAPVSWFVGAIVLSLLLWAIGKAIMPKASAEHKMIWGFAMVFVIVTSFITSFLLPMLMPNMDMTAFNPEKLTDLSVAFWFIVFGAALFAGGWLDKNPMGLLLGIVWIFASVLLTSSAVPAGLGFLHISLLAGIPFVIMGIMKKK